MTNVLHAGELDSCAGEFFIFRRGHCSVPGDVLPVRLQRSVSCRHGVCAMASPLVLVIRRAPYAGRVYDRGHPSYVFLVPTLYL